MAFHSDTKRFTIIAIITDDKVTELFCIEDDLCKFFDFPNGNFMLKLDNRLLCRRYSIVLKSKVC